MEIPQSGLSTPERLRAFLRRQAENAGRARDDASAALWLRLALALEPDDGALWLDLGWHLRALGKERPALRALARAARRLPWENGAAEYQAALILVETGETRAALAALRIAVRREPALAWDAVTEEAFASALLGEPAFEEMRRVARGAP